MEHWNNKYNSELTTIKFKSYRLGWIVGFITGACMAALLLLAIYG